MPRQLTEREFEATFTEKMHNVTDSATNVLDIRPYVESVPAADLEGHSIYKDFVKLSTGATMDDTITYL